MASTSAVIRPTPAADLVERRPAPRIPEWRRRTLEAAAARGESRWIATAAIDGDPRL